MAWSISNKTIETTKHSTNVILMNTKYFFGLILYLLIQSFTQAQEQGSDAAELAKKLSNPISSLISVPFQNNSDYGIGEYKGSRNTMNIQPVVPVSITPDRKSTRLNSSHSQISYAVF